MVIDRFAVGALILEEGAKNATPDFSVYPLFENGNTDELVLRIADKQFLLTIMEMPDVGKKDGNGVDIHSVND